MLRLAAIGFPSRALCFNLIPFWRYNDACLYCRRQASVGKEKLPAVASHVIFYVGSNPSLMTRVGGYSWDSPTASRFRSTSQCYISLSSLLILTVNTNSPASFAISLAIMTPSRDASNRESVKALRLNEMGKRHVKVANCSGYAGKKYGSTL